jgi:dTDP-4-dehydrorhamnose 3,5-epimerase
MEHQMLRLEDFRDEIPWEDTGTALAELDVPDRIDGVVLRRLVTHSDARGDLTVLLSRKYVADAMTPHVYLVRAAAGSVRAWVFHRRQSDQLAFAMGSFRVVLQDLRPGSPTHGLVMVLEVGANNPVQLTIPPFVIHAVQNYGTSDAHFINMPTAAYDPAWPDKSRIPIDHPEAPYRFT